MVTPFSLLITPAAYLYVRSVLQQELQFKKRDWLLLVPAVLYAINLIPLYTLTNEEKRIYLMEFFKNKSLQAHISDGIFPAYVFSFLRLVWSLVFVVLNFRLIRQFKKQAAKRVLLDNAALIRWLTIFNSLLLAILAAVLAVAIIAPIKKTNLSVVHFVLGISVIIICIQLFIRPKLLYGIFQPTSYNADLIVTALAGEKKLPGTVTALPPAETGISSTSTTEPVEEITISQSESILYKKILDTLFQHQKVFLQTDYSLDKLVMDTHIHRYTLSAFINREFGMGFREFLNRHRVNYFKENLTNPEWKKLTLEAISEQCGFSSRSTFIKNFKEITGQTPSEYVKAGCKKTVPTPQNTVPV